MLTSRAIQHAKRGVYVALENNYPRCTTINRLFSNGPKDAAKDLGKDTVKAEKTLSSLWSSTEFWARLGAIAGWGMSGAAIYDASQSSAELISLNMTGVLVVYSSLFARWAFIVKPQNLLLAACHVTNVFAQLNQMRRALVYKIDNGKEKEVEEYAYNAAAVAAGGAACILLGPRVQTSLTAANLGVISTVSAAAAGPFTVHFWAPMSKW
eukprot:CAMPEP_0184855586 /NCGR_PEP_ID=MMETSP0580-20130426/786_1 /TAXON_ID=1118495 /ORGANISM="Dactyliosolen fragilissimus" /LENGTH=209 /DNA_ID=CAMNT_0027350135 /DNA_START=54 /DNA_END=680 /DNA_ORIENTATION=+